MNAVENDSGRTIFSTTSHITICFEKTLPEHLHGCVGYLMAGRGPQPYFY